MMMTRALILAGMALPLPAFAQEPLPQDPLPVVAAAPDPAAPMRMELPDFPAPVPLIAAEPPRLSAPVRAMIEEAIRGDDSAAVAAVVKVALATQPYDAAEIKAMHRAYLDRKASLLAQRSHAEVERIRNAGLLELWKGQVELGAYHSTGNTDNLGVTGALRLDRKGLAWEHALRFNAEYQENAGARSREQFGASYQPRYTLEDGFFGYGRAQFESDPLQGFDQRYSFSGGLGYRVLKRRNMTLSVEAGPALRRTLFASAVPETTWSTLTSLDFDWKVTEGMKLTQVASSYVGSDNNTFTSLTGLEAGMAKGLKAKLSYSIQHEAAPSAGAVRTDTTSRFSLVYGF